VSRAARGIGKQQTIAEARRLCTTIQLELKARTFDYAKRFPDSDRIKQRGIETPEKIQPISVTEFSDSWLLSMQGEVKKIHPRLRSKYVFPNESGAAPNVRWATDVVWRRIITRAEVPHRPIGQCRHSFAVLALKQHKPLNWIQRQIGHRTLRMLLKHYWRWMPTDDLSAKEMSSLESAATPSTPNHAHHAHPARKRHSSVLVKTMIQIGKNPIKLADEAVWRELVSASESLIIREIQGISAIRSVFWLMRSRKSPVRSWVFIEIPYSTKQGLFFE
jgi:hypothetical protein